MSLTGDFAALNRLAKKFGRLESHAGREVIKGIATYSEAATLKSFRAQQSPAGDSWEGGPSVSSPMLVKSGKMRGAFKSRISGLTYSLRNTARYAHYHQSGAVLRDSAPGKKFVRTRSRGAGRGRSGPRQKFTFAGPIRKGRERGFLPQRAIMPHEGSLPPRWAAGYVEVSERVMSRILGVG